MPTTTAEQDPAKIARDLDVDLAICEAATSGEWVIHQDTVYANGYAVAVVIYRDPEDTRFIAAARTGWPYAIRRAQESEREADKLREENALLLEQIEIFRGSRLE